MWTNLIGYSAPLSQKTFLADEISQKLNNPLSPYFMRNDRFHVSAEKQDNRIHLQCHIYNVTKSSSDLCTYSFLTHSVNSPLYRQVICHTREKEVIHSISFPRWFLLVHRFAVEAFNIWVTVWHSVFKWSVNKGKKCGLILWKLKFLQLQLFTP